MAAKCEPSQRSAASRNEDVIVWRNKTEVAKKNEILREVHKLEIQIQALEREKGTHIYSKRSDFRIDFGQLEDLDSKMVAERKTEKIRLRQLLQKISHMVQRFQRELKDVKPTPEFVEKLKVIMEDIEGTINNFKLQQRQKYEELMKEERVVRQELLALEKRFETWAQIPDGATSARSTVKPPSTARDITTDLPAEVAAFERFLQQTGGVRGGWDEYDHQTFLKFRNRYKGKSVFIEHLIPGLPTRKESEIHEHESWYQEYLYLMDAKKDAIKQWRKKKQEERDGLLANAQSDSDSEEEKQEELKSHYKEKVEEEKRERFARLNAWKIQKELERARETEKKMREEMERAHRLETEKKAQMELKMRVQEYRLQRQEEEEFFKQQDTAREEHERDRKKQLSAREIVRFRERDQRSISDKVMRQRAKEEEEREQEMKRERIKRQVEMFVPSDPTRLYKPTKGWKERLKDPGPTGGGQVISSNVPHRAVPSWRQGLH